MERVAHPGQIASDSNGMMCPTLPRSISALGCGQVKALSQDTPLPGLCGNSYTLLNPLTSHFLCFSLISPFKSWLSLWISWYTLPLWAIILAHYLPLSTLAASQPLDWKKLFRQIWTWFCQFTNWVFHNFSTKILLIPECLGCLTGHQSSYDSNGLGIVLTFFF